MSLLSPKGFLNTEMEHRAQGAYTINLKNAVS